MDGGGSTGWAAHREHPVERGDPALNAAQSGAPLRVGASWPSSLTPTASILSE